MGLRSLEKIIIPIRFNLSQWMGPQSISKGEAVILGVAIQREQDARDEENPFFAIRMGLLKFPCRYPCCAGILLEWSRFPGPKAPKGLTFIPPRRTGHLFPRTWLGAFSPYKIYPVASVWFPAGSGAKGPSVPGPRRKTERAFTGWASVSFTAVASKPL